MNDIRDLMTFTAGSTLGTVGARALASRVADDEIDYVLTLARLPAARLAPQIQPSHAARIYEAKVMITGGFGVGKTTMVGSASAITPLTTEKIMSSAGVGVDDTRVIPGKTTTTCCLDYGKAPIDRDLVLHLFGTPGQTRFWFMWDDLIRGCVGAVLMVDTRRIADCFAAIDFFESRRLPYLLAINCFDGVQYHDSEDVREALAVSNDVPIVAFDARCEDSSRAVLISLVEYILTMRRARSSILSTPHAATAESSV